MIMMIMTMVRMIMMMYHNTLCRSTTWRWFILLVILWYPSSSHHHQWSQYPHWSLHYSRWGGENRIPSGHFSHWQCTRPGGKPVECYLHRRFYWWYSHHYCEECCPIGNWWSRYVQCGSLSHSLCSWYSVIKDHHTKICGAIVLIRTWNY